MCKSSREKEREATMAIVPGDSGNLLSGSGQRAEGEILEELQRIAGAVRVERIVSTGQATPAGQWYDQPWGEWVLLVSGQARLRFASECQERVMGPGDYVWIPAHCRHRVEWTDPNCQTVWLALHECPEQDLT